MDNYNKVGLFVWELGCVQTPGSEVRPVLAVGFLIKILSIVSTSDVSNMTPVISSSLSS